MIDTATPAPTPEVAAAPVQVPPSVPPQPSYAVAPTRDVSKFKKYGLIAAVALVIAAGLWMLTSQRTIRSVAVMGTGTSTLQATTAEITFVYFQQTDNRATATNQGKSGFAQLSEVIKGMGIESFSQSASQTVPLSTDPTRMVYEFRQSAQVKVSGPEKIQAVTDNLESSNNVIIAQTRYVPDNSQETQQSLYDKAMEDARAKAGALARLSKGRVGRVLSVVEVVNNTADGQVTVDTKDQSGNVGGSNSTIELQRSVNVTFELQ